MIVAIDGPSGSGKSTIAKILAKELELLYIDTGAMYRSVALYCIRNRIDIADTEAVRLALEFIKIDIEHVNGEQRIFLNGEDITSDVRTQEIAKGASDVAQIQEVRVYLVDLQRRLGEKKSVIMDGRDIGTVVFPNANIKIYLDASVDARCSRRCSELKELGHEPIQEIVEKEIIERDFNDMNREFSPLKKAEDAILVDTSNMLLEEVVQEVKNLILGVI